MKKTSRLSVIIEDDLHAELVALASAGQCSIAAVIRKLVVDGVAKRGAGAAKHGGKKNV